MDFDYTGQSFASRPGFAPVLFFNGRKEIPAEGYRIIGRGVLTVAPKTGDHDRMGELREQARKHGADAVCIVDSMVKKTGILPENQDDFIPPHSPLSQRIPLQAANSSRKGKSANTGVEAVGPKKRSVKMIRVLFLKKTADLEKELKQKNPLL